MNDYSNICLQNTGAKINFTESAILSISLFSFYKKTEISQFRLKLSFGQICQTLVDHVLLGLYSEEFNGTPKNGKYLDLIPRLLVLIVHLYLFKCRNVTLIDMQKTL